MSEPLANPTLVLGLGRFGLEVCALLAREAAADKAPSNLVVLRAGVGPAAASPGTPADSGIASIADEAALVALLDSLHDAARGMLDLKQRVETTGGKDARPPRLDLFLLADLSEPAVAPLLPPLVQRIGVRLREAFRPIFSGAGGRLTVCPVLAIPRAVKGRSEVREAVDALDALSRAQDERQRPLAPIYLVEDQCARYVLTPAEVVRTVAAWLHLVLYSGLRHHEDALKNLVEQDGDAAAPFASFACATLEFDTQPLERYCAGRIALEIVEAMLEEQEAIADAENAAKRLSPEASLFAALARGSNDKPFVDDLKLDRAVLELRDPIWSETPEQIVARLDPYVAAVLDAAQTQRDDIEGFRMESAARRVDAAGLEVLSATEKAIDDEVARCLGESPAGAERARVRLSALESRFQRLDAKTRGALDRPALPPLPEPTGLLDSGGEAREALERRPRMARLFVWGAASAGLLAVLLAGVARLTWRAAVSDQIPFFALEAAPQGLPASLIGWPWIGLWALLVSVGSVAWGLWRHTRAEQRRLCLCFEDLRRAAHEHYSELERYFAKRLAYSQDLWAARVARHLLARVRGERALLDGARASLQKCRDRLGEEVRAQASGLGDAASGVLFRGLLSGEDLEQIYEAKARPQNSVAQAQRFLTEATTARGSWRSGGFAEVRALLGFARELCPDLSQIRPFADAPAWGGAARTRAREFLSQLASKLTVPLELDVDTEERSTVHVAYVPEGSRGEVEAVLCGEDLTRRWTVRGAADERRMHLFIATRNIERRALKLLEPEAEAAS